MAIERNKKIVKNTITLYIRMGLTMLVSLYTSRVVLNSLGIEDYGIYNLVGGIVVLFSFLSNALNGAVQRFLTFELGRKDYKQFNRIFNSSLFALSVISLFITLLLETIGLWFLKEKLVIDSSRLSAAFWVFQLSIISFIVNIITAPYNSVIIAFEEMSIYAYIGILETFLKLIIVLLLPFLPFDKLITYGFLIALITVIVRVVNIVYCHVKIIYCKLELIYDKGLLKQLLSFSGWSILGSVCNILSNQGINMVFNIFHGVVLNAAIGIANQVSNSIFQFVGNFQTAFSPQITKLYANGEKEEVCKLVYKSSKFSFFLLLIIAFPVLVNIKEILILWLKIIPECTVPFCSIILITMLIDSISGPLWMLINAAGDIRSYQIIMSIIGGLNIVLVYIALHYDYSSTIALSTKIITSILLILTRFIILHQKVKFSISEFFTHVLLRIIIISIAASLLGYIIFFYFNFINRLYQILLRSAFSEILILLIIYYVGLSINEQQFVKSMIIKRLKK